MLVQYNQKLGAYENQLKQSMMQHQQTWQDRLKEKIEENSAVARESQNRARILLEQTEQQLEVINEMEKGKCQLEAQNR